MRPRPSLPTARTAAHPAAALAMLVLAACSSRVSGPPVCDGLWGAEESSIDAPFDVDGDGFFDGSNPDCVATYDLVDCNDGRPEISPAATEGICNGVDEDCDPTTLDVDDVDGDGVDWCRDCDDDDPAADFTDIDGDGYGPCDGDCDETNPDHHPDRDDPVDDGIDQDCDNTPPRVVEAVLTPDPVGIATPIVGVATVEDDEDVAFTFTWRWLLGGVEIEGVSGDTLAPEHFALGDTVRAHVTPHDGTQSGEEVATEPVVVRNTPPVYTSVVIDPPTPGASDTLTALISGWTDPDPGDVEGEPDFQWYVNDVEIGPNEPTLVSAAFDRGDTVYVTVRATDGEDRGPPIASADVVIDNARPSTPGLEVTPVLATTADPLFCDIVTSSTDADGDAVTYTWAWLQDGAATAYTTDTVPAAALTQGSTWTCLVTPSDGLTPGVPGEASVTILTKAVFAPVGFDQSWTVPAGTSVVLVKMWGGAGGGSDAEAVQHPGGPGGYAEAVVPVTPGETLTLLVGEGGPISSTTFDPAYPAGGVPGARAGYFQGGGGGRSAVERAGVELIVAGGGGGAGCSGWVASVGILSSIGGEGGGVLGGDGDAISPDSTSSYVCSGKGATPFQAGDGGSGTRCQGFVGEDGDRNQGADGLDHPAQGNCGGAGGDGYWGGGSGALHAGGGGGSGYLHPNDTTDGVLVAEPASGAPEDDDPDWTTDVATGLPGATGGPGSLVIWH